MANIRTFITIAGDWATVMQSVLQPDGAVYTPLGYALLKT